MPLWTKFSPLNYAWFSALGRVAVAANHPRHRHFRRALFNNRGEISGIRERPRDAESEGAYMNSYTVSESSSILRAKIR